MNGLQSALVSLDSSVLEWLHRHASRKGMEICMVISRIGSPLAMTLLAFAGALLLATSEEWIMLGGWIAAFGGASMLDNWLKFAVHRPRPPYAAAVIHHPTWSFPSGHAMGSLVGFGMLAYVLVRFVGGTTRVRFAVWGAAMLVTLLIGASRLYLGVHYLSDIVGGYAIGGAWLAICIWGIELADSTQKRTQLGLNPRG